MLNCGSLWGFTNWLDQCCLWFVTSVTPTYYSECKTDLKLFYDTFIQEYKIFHTTNKEWKFMTFQFIWSASWPVKKPHRLDLACGPPMEWIVTITAVVIIIIIIMSVSNIREYSKISQRTISIWEILVILLHQHKRVIYPHSYNISTHIHPYPWKTSARFCLEVWHQRKKQDSA